MRAGSLAGSVVVITGASSGIGRATAHAFARQGARLVLAARRTDMLEEAARECRHLDAAAVAVPADVTDPADMRHLLDEAVSAFGRVDIWINNAGVGAVGWFERVPLAAHRRVIETNLLGPLHGAHAVLPHFIDRGRGVLINTVSAGGWAATPASAAYVASKFGLRGLTEALRHDMRRYPGIHICGLYPTFVDTPGLRHAGNYTGRRLDPKGPMQRPERIAKIMVDVARRPDGTVPVGLASRLARIAYALAPDLLGGAMLTGIEYALRRAPAAPPSDGNLFHPPGDRLAIRGRTSRGEPVDPWLAVMGVAGTALLGGMVAHRLSAKH